MNSINPVCSIPFPTVRASDIKQTQVANVLCGVLREVLSLDVDLSI